MQVHNQSKYIGKFLYFDELQYCYHSAAVKLTMISDNLKRFPVIILLQ